MIERYTIKFGPAVSQKELEMALHEANVTQEEYTEKLDLTKFKARIEFIGDFKDVKKMRTFIEELKGDAKSI